MIKCLTTFARIVLLTIYTLIPIRENIYAQYLTVREYTVSDGLPQSQARSIYQTHNGFLWVSTRNGLARFDGIEFVKYYKKDGIPGLVHDLCEDRANDFWVLTEKGMCKLVDDRFEYFKPPETYYSYRFLNAVPGDFPGTFYLLVSRSGDIHTNLLKFEKGIYSEFPLGNNIPDDFSIYTMAYDTLIETLYLIDNRNILYQWKNNTLHFISEGAESFRKVRGRLFVISNDSVYELKAGKLIAEGRKEVLETLGRDLKMNVPYNYSGIFQDFENNLWFNSESNICRLLPQVFQSFSFNEIGLTDIWAISSDRFGHIWFGSIYGGLIEFDGRNFKKRDEYRRVTSNSVFYKGSRQLSNGEMWLSMNNGVLIWDGISFRKLKGIPDQAQICYIHEDPDDHNIYLGTSIGLYKLSENQIRFYPEFTDEKFGVIEGMAKDDSGFYWISGHHGLVKFDGEKPVKVTDPVLPGQYTSNIEKDSRGGIWVVSYDGVYFKSKSSGNFVPGLPGGINIPANTLAIIDSSRIIVGRVTDLCLIDLDKFYNNERDYYRLFDYTHGYLGGECLENGIIKAMDGRYWLATSKNVTIFDPSRLKKNPHPPLLNLTGFYYRNDSLEWERVSNSSANDIPHISLKRWQNNLQIRYAGISTTNPEKVIYSTKLEGRDNRWSSFSADRSVTFDELRPGHYTLLINAQNADGVVTTEPLKIRFNIVPAFYETVWFKILASLVSVLLIIYVTRKIMIKSQTKKEERERLKSELSRMQLGSLLKELDPHFLFNVMTSVGSMVMKNNKEIAYNYLAKLARLLRGILQGPGMNQTLMDELNLVRDYCELQKLRYGDRFNFIIDVSDDADLSIKFPRMVIQTLIENSIKHGFSATEEGGDIHLSIEHEMDRLKIAVRDNGIGINQAAGMKTNGTQLGLRTIRQLLQLMNRGNISEASFNIRDLEGTEYGRGTEALIIIPERYKFGIE